MCKPIRDKEKISHTVWNLKPLQNVLGNLWRVLFFSKELVNTSVKETNSYAEQFLHGRELPIRLPAQVWKPVTEGEIYVVLGLFMLMRVIQKPTLIVFYHQKSDFCAMI
jgi:hypothetical protein